MISLTRANEKRQGTARLWPSLSGTVLFSCTIALTACLGESGGKDTGKGNPKLPESSETWSFTDITSAAGFSIENGFTAEETGTQDIIFDYTGGVAAGDYNGDGWVDLYIVREDFGSNLLFQNQGNGTFKEVAAQANVARPGIRSSAPIFADFDGDGRLDLFVLTFGQNDPALFKNLGGGTFVDVIGGSGLANIGGGISSSLGDIDLDGDLDLYITHWQSLANGESLWENKGAGNFIDISTDAGIFQSSMNDLTAIFSDIDGDGWPDLLVAADFGTSQVFHNNGDNTFLNVTTPVISDENGMGASVGDYDNDGDLDWFVTSIYESDPGGLSGNRLYRNTGNGSFEDATSESEVRMGHWGWGSCFQDFNNDGHLDLFHVNGWTFLNFLNDPSVMFISNGDGTFSERASELTIEDSGQGRGLVCFDYDRDGDIDIFIANNRNPPTFLRNDRGNDLNFIHIKLEGPDSNTEAIGAKIYVTTNGVQQMRELRAGSNYVSQDPAVAHFGIGAIKVIDEIRIVWPTDQTITTMNNVPANQFLVIQK